MSKEVRMSLEKIFDCLGELIAFLTLALFVFNHLNANFHWVTNENVVVTLSVVYNYAILVLVAVVGFEATIKRNIIIRIIFYLLLAAAIVILCFPGTYQALIEQAKSLISK